MISVEGAGLIAQVLPVGLLILAFEGRTLRPAYAGAPIGLRWFFAATVMLVWGGAIAVEFTCIAAVASNTAIGVESAILVVVGYAVGALVFAYTVVSLTLAFLIDDQDSK